MISEFPVPNYQNYTHNENSQQILIKINKECEIIDLVDVFPSSEKQRLS